MNNLFSQDNISRFDSLIEKFASIKERYGDEYPIIFYEPTLDMEDFLQGNKSIEFFTQQEEAFKFAQSLEISFILIVPNNEQELIQNLQTLDNIHQHRMFDFEEEALFRDLFDDKIEEKARKSLKAYVFITLLDFLTEKPVNENEEEVMVMSDIKEIVKEFRQEFVVLWYDPNANSESKEKLEKNIEVDLQQENIYTDFKSLLSRLNSYSGPPYHLILSWKDEFEEIIQNIDSLKDLLGLYIYSGHTMKIQAANEKIDVTKTLEELAPIITKGIRTRSKLTNTFPAFATNFDAMDKSHIYNVHYYLKGLINFNNRKQAKDDFLKLARKIYQDNDKKLVRFETEYDEFHHKNILNWYTKDSPVYKLVNNCLRISSSDSILYCRFILKDMERAIREEYQQNNKNFNGLVYRGAYISPEEWDKLQRNIGQEIEMYGFLSTSVDQRPAVNFFRGDPQNKIFITIIVPPLPELDEQGFADLSQISDFQGEHEILFNVRSRFRILEANVSGIDNRGTKGRHLVLLYGAQALRRYMTKHQPLIYLDFSKDEVKCDLCGSKEKLFGFNQAEVQCFDCLVKNEIPKNTPLVAIDSLRNQNSLLKNFRGKFLGFNKMTNPLPYYGYQCCDCKAKGKAKYYKWISSSQEISQQCSDCFLAKKANLQPNTILISEENPYTFWGEYQAEWEAVDSDYQIKFSEQVRGEDQGDVFMEVQRYDLCIEYRKRVFKKLQRKRCREMEKLKIYDKTGRAYDNLGEYQQALNYLKKALDLRRTFYGEIHIHTAGSYHNLASVYEQMGAHLQALDYFTRALDITRVLEGEFSRPMAESYNNLATVFNSLGYYQQALKYHRKALEINKLIYGKKHLQAAGSYHNLASIYQSLGDEKKALEYYQRALDVRKAIYGENHPEVATAMNNIASVYENLKTHKEALEYYQIALEIQKPIYGEKHPNIASSYSSLAIVYHGLGEYQQAKGYLEKALEIKKEIYGEKDSHIARTYNNFGLLENSMGNYQKALEYYQGALDILTATYSENHPDIAATYSGLAAVYENLGKHQYTGMYFTKALDLTKSLYGEKHPEVANSYNNLAAFYQKFGKPQEALEYHKKALSITEALYGEKHPSTATSHNNLGLLYQVKGDYQQALTHFQKALGLLKGIHEEKHPKIATLYNNIALVSRETRDYEKALKGFVKALDLKKEIHGENHQETAGVYSNIAGVYYGMRDFPHALEYFNKALEINLTIYDEKHPEIATSYNNLSSVFHNLGKYQQAWEYVMKALDIRKAVYGEKHLMTATSYNNLASLLDKMGDSQQALQLFMKSLDITKEIYGEKHPDMAISYNNVACVYEGFGEFKKALEYRRKALEIRKGIFGENHPQILEEYMRFSRAYQSLGERELALEFQKKALRM